MATSHHAATRLAVDTLQTSLPGDSDDNDKHKTASLTPPETPVVDSRDTADYARNQPFEFLYDLEFERACDDASDYTEFGRGVWSAVYKATTTWMSRNYNHNNNNTFTPPPSPTPSPASTTATSSSRSRILAVKTPLRRDAHPVLKAEAWILTLTSRKSTLSSTSTYTVPFYGYIPSSSSLVLQAIPLSLATHIETCANHARRNFSTRTMFEPVLSSAQCWRELASQLIRGLDWLHNEVGVVHGDIKPHNILLRERHDDDTNEFQYEALYADFSSAHYYMPSPDDNDDNEENHGNDSSETITTGAGSALTPPFAAPELMTLAALKSTSPSLLCTPASDVFALALTLLAAATGDVLVYSSSGTSEMQRLAMSREGYRALEYVRSGPQASRVVRGGLVERTVAPAITKIPDERVVAAEWRVAEA